MSSLQLGIKERIDFFVAEIAGIWRFRWTAIWIVWVLAVFGWIASYSIANTYDAKASFFIDRSTALRPLLEGIAIDSGVQSQLDLVRKSMLSKPQLEDLALEAGLFMSGDSTIAREHIVQKLSDNILITHETSQGSDSIFTISHVSSNRDRSVYIVSTILNVFMNDVVGSKLAGQDAAQKFLVEQIVIYEGRLYDSENRLAEFKTQNLGLVPGERGNYFSRLQNENEGLEGTQAKIRLAQRRQDQLRKQLSGEVLFIAEPGRENLQNNGTASRLREAEVRLQELLLRFTEKHPEVIATRETIVRLTERYANELAAVGSATGAGGSSIPRSANPVHQGIQVSLNEVEVELAALRGEMSDRESKIADLTNLLGEAAEVEAQFSRLNRDYGVVKAQYDSLVKRLETARLSELADESGVVKFEIIDPPFASIEPIGPNRQLLVSAALLFALSIGIGVAFLKNAGNPVFADSHSLSMRTGMPVLGSIGIAYPDEWRNERGANFRRFIFVSGSLGVAYIAAFLNADRVTIWLQNFITVS